MGQISAGAVLAIGAAAAFGAASVLQFCASHAVPEERAGQPRLLVRLLRIRGWRWSTLLAAAAFALQVAALSMAPLLLVQPLLVTGLVWYVLLFGLLQHRRPDARSLLESGLCLLGLGAFLAVAQPARSHGKGFESFGSAALLGVVVVATVGGCLLSALKLGRKWRPLPLAVAAGICYGVTAGLISSLGLRFEPSALAVFGQWQVYAIAVLGPFGVLLSQNAYQAGPMGAPALATITVTDPLVSIAVGLLWLDERIRTGPWIVLGEVLALAVVVVAVSLLARRAPHVAGA
ncbi:DMT family transporter [Micromonospora eburnea]|uniref:DMT family transporter n=1 Tax=Micromonospora eburnea TaxID=227316 RepID=UPI001428D7B8|nr:DMT family transporter [Micromonospora eburnea]